MRRSAAVPLVLAALLAAGCSTTTAGSGTAADGSPPPSSATTAAPTTSAAPADDISACAAGTCTVTVPEGTVIPIDAAGIRVERLTVDRVAPNSVTLRAESGGGRSVVATGPGGRSTLNGLRVVVVAIDGDRVTLELAPA